MNEARFGWLLQRFKKEHLTSDELQEFFQMLESGDHDDQLSADIQELLKSYGTHPLWNNRKENNLLSELHQQLGFREQRARVIPFYRKPWLRWSVAALFTFLCIGGAYLVTVPKEKVKKVAVAKPVRITPGGNKAILTLADGQQVVLDKASNGNLAVQGGVKIIKLSNNLLSYKGQTPLNEVAYNTLTTPRGGQFQVELPDGSRVWLNSASSLKYPTAFSGKNREVDLSGEAYFEIVTNKTKPFKVNTRNVKVQVLGTGFNVMAYGDDEAVKTTLVHGSVQLNAGQHNLVITPGQQASFIYGTNTMSVSTADMEEVLAWKEGKFQFNQTPVETIMKQVERWYDVDVIYKGDLSDIHLSGLISRREDVEKLLDIFRATERLRFVTQGRTITVLPY